MTSVEQPIVALYLLIRSNDPYKGGSIGQSNETFEKTVFECHVHYSRPIVTSRILFIHAVWQVSSKTDNTEAA